MEHALIILIEISDQSVDSKHSWLILANISPDTRATTLVYGKLIKKSDKTG